MKACLNAKGAACNLDMQSSVRCHAILFPHAAPQSASYMYNQNLMSKDGLLDFDALKELMMLFLLMTKEIWIK